MTNIEELLDQYDAVHNEFDLLSAGEINDQKFKELNERRNRLEKEMSRQITQLAKTDPIFAAKMIERSSDQRVRWIEYWSYVTGGDGKDVIARIKEATAQTVHILNGGE